MELICLVHLLLQIASKIHILGYDSKLVLVLLVAKMLIQIVRLQIRILNILLRVLNIVRRSWSKVVILKLRALNLLLVVYV